jgi:hypothetical protein
MYALKPDRDEKLWEMQVLTFMVPENLERLRAAKKKDELVEVLELTSDVVAGPTSLEVRCLHALLATEEFFSCHTATTCMLSW